MNQTPGASRAPLNLAVLSFAFATMANAQQTDDYRLVDLTHAYDEQTIYWPTSPSKFELETLAEGETEGGYFYSAYSVCTPEHGGTHLDAPVHFAKDGFATDELPLENLVAPAIVIDVAAKASRDRDYRAGVADVDAFEAAHGRIPAGSIVLLHTGWSRHWPDVRAYLGDDTPGDASRLSFPGYGDDAARLLVESRRVAMLGVDTASIDYGRSSDFPVHRIAGAANVAGLENLTNLNELPATGTLLIALPMKIAGGSGGPVRVVAMIPR
jgi:kynurenine formamidase